MQSSLGAPSFTASAAFWKRKTIVRSGRNVRVQLLIVKAEERGGPRPEVSRINITQLVESASVSLQEAQQHDAQIDTYTVLNGYGQASEVTARATKGARVQIKVDINLTATSENSYSSAKDKAEKLISEDEKKYLNENHTGYGAAAGWFSGFFGVIGGGGYNYNRNESRDYNLSAKENKEKVEEVVRTLSNSTVKVVGTIDVTGVDLYYESRGRVYIQTTTIKTADGEKKILLSTDNMEGVVVYDDTKKQLLPHEGALNIVPLS